MTLSWGRSAGNGSLALDEIGHKDRNMPQAQLPIFAEGTSLITPELAFERRGGQVVYFNGQLPVFTHEQDDLATFRMFTTQLIVNGTASQGQIAKTFGLSLTAVKRCVKKFRERGSKGFYHAPAKRQGRKLNPERLRQAQGLLDQGQRVPAISAEMGVLASTLHKAIDSGRLQASKKRTLLK
jgi:transposase